MTLLWQLVLMVASLALMFTVALSGAWAGCLLVVAYVGGWAVSRYDDGVRR